MRKVFGVVYAVILGAILFVISPYSPTNWHWYCAFLLALAGWAICAWRPESPWTSFFDGLAIGTAVSIAGRYSFADWQWWIAVLVLAFNAVICSIFAEVMNEIRRSKAH